VSWRDSLSPDLQGNATLAGLDSVEALAKEHINVQKLIGADKIARPQQDWTPQQFNEFYLKMGRPADPKDYDLSALEVPDGLPIDADFQATMIQKMHARGASQEMVAGILADFYEAQGGQFSTALSDMQNHREEGINDLRTEWGKSFDAQVDLAKRAFVAGAGDGFEALAALKLSDGGSLGDHPAVIRAFAALGSKMSEHGLVGGTSIRTAQSPSEALNEKQKLMSDPEFLKSYLDENHLEHSAAVRRIHDLTVAEVGTAS